MSKGPACSAVPYRPRSEPGNSVRRNVPPASSAASPETVSVRLCPDSSPPDKKGHGGTESASFSHAPWGNPEGKGPILPVEEEIHARRGCWGELIFWFQCLGIFRLHPPLFEKGLLSAGRNPRMCRGVRGFRPLLQRRVHSLREDAVTGPEPGSLTRLGFPGSRFEGEVEGGTP